MSEMAASIAHELNQPMTALVTHAYACCEWASANPPNMEKVSATSAKIVQESTRASAVVKRIRSLFNNDEPARIPTDLNLLVEDSAQLLRDEQIREGVRIELKLSRAIHTVEVDPVQIQQVILNLSKNAVEAMAHTDREKTLTISTEPQGDNQIVTTISDTGPGIAPDLIPHIFEPFFSTKKNGTGIGLAICRSIIEAHSGRISASNRESGGAIVQFTIAASS